MLHPAGKSHGQRSLAGCSEALPGRLGGAKARPQLRNSSVSLTSQRHLGSSLRSPVEVEGNECMDNEMATYSSILAWRIPGMEDPDGLLSMGSHRRDQEGRRGSEEAVPGPSVFPSGEPGVSGDFWVQSCLTLCDPIDGSPPGSSIPGILQARTLEWVAISFSNA